MRFFSAWLTEVNEKNIGQWNNEAKDKNLVAIVKMITRKDKSLNR
jgi:hypothetical protein